MNVVQNLIADLREKHLWPVAAVLIVALIAVPGLLLGGGNAGVPVASIPPVAAPSARVPALPAVSVTPIPSNARLTGRERNPFAQQAQPSSGKAAANTGTSATAPKSSSGTGPIGGTSTHVTSTSTTPTTTTPTTTTAPTPTPTVLTATEAFRVAISLTRQSGSAYTVGRVTRLSVLPSEQRPLLIELGVMNGRHRVLFAVQPGAVVHGPGICTPGPLDCEVISLAPNQIEGIATTEPNGRVSGALVSVTSIKVEAYPSSAAANKARLDESAAGQRLLRGSRVGALSRFQYRLSLGAVVGLRKVAAGRH